MTICPFNRTIVFSLPFLFWSEWSDLYIRGGLALSPRVTIPIWQSTFYYTQVTFRFILLYTGHFHIHSIIHRSLFLLRKLMCLLLILWRIFIHKTEIGSLINSIFSSFFISHLTTLKIMFLKTHWPFFPLQDLRCLLFVNLYFPFTKWMIGFAYQVWFGNYLPVSLYQPLRFHTVMLKTFCLVVRGRNSILWECMLILHI